MQFKWFCALAGALVLLGSAEAQQPPAEQKSLAATLGVYVFPSNGQSTTQQSKDEGACYQWAVNDTGSDPFEVVKQEAAAKEGGEQKEKQIESAGAGAGAKGALGGAAAGALIGEVSHGDAGESAAYGAAAGAVIAHRAICWAAAMLAMSPLASAVAKEDPPPVSPDGLQLQTSTKSRLVYAKPGATFTQYDKFAILECYVEFEKDWEKDYNASRMGLEGRLTDKDVERMKTGLAEEFREEFTRELQDKGGYQVVDQAAPDVLVLRPALINVEVNAPDVMSADIGRTIVRSAGQMTLYLELWDSATNTILARVMDAKADEGFAEQANRVTNTAAADRILSEWARELRERLDEVHGMAKQ